MIFIYFYAALCHSLVKAMTATNAAPVAAAVAAAWKSIYQSLLEGRMCHMSFTRTMLSERISLKSLDI